MTWTIENWMAEGLIFIAIGLVIAKVFCILAGCMDRK